MFIIDEPFAQDFFILKSEPIVEDETQDKLFQELMEDISMFHIMLECGKISGKDIQEELKSKFTIKRKK